MTILICEDEPSIAALLADICADAGHKAIVTKTAEDCARWGTEIAPPLMFLDVMLPGGMSGIQLCRYFRDHPATRESHLTIVTARRGEQIEAACRSAGASRLVYKPFSIVTIESIVAEVGRARRAA